MIDYVVKLQHNTVALKRESFGLFAVTAFTVLAMEDNSLDELVDFCQSYGEDTTNPPLFFCDKNTKKARKALLTALVQYSHQIYQSVPTQMAMLSNIGNWDSDQLYLVDINADPLHDNDNSIIVVEDDDDAQAFITLLDNFEMTSCCDLKVAVFVMSLDGDGDIVIKSYHSNDRC